MNALGGRRFADGFLVKLPAFRVKQIRQIIGRVLGVFDANRPHPAIGAADGKTTIAIEMNVHHPAIAPGDQQRGVEHGGGVQPQVPRLPGGAAHDALAQRPVPGQPFAPARGMDEAR